jgi:uncharacterized membrane protein
MSSRSLLSAFCALALCALSCVAQAEVTQAQVPKSYRLTFIDIAISSPFGTSLSIDDVNNEGEVVGTRIPEGSSISEAFIWRDGEFEIITNPFPDGGSVRAEGINDRSDVLISAQDQQAQAHFFLWQQGELIELDFDNEPDLRLGAVLDVNNRRRVLAFARDAELQNFNVVWRRHQLTRLQEPPSGANAIARVINNRGDVGGVINADTFLPGVWRHGLLVTLPLPEGASAGSVNALNDRGIAAGVLNFPDSFNSGAAVWTRRRAIQLTPLAGKDSAIASAVNDHGLVTGLSFSDFIMQSDRLAILWRRPGARAIDLNTLIAPDDPLKPFVVLRAALLINDRGQILAEGRDSRQANPDDLSFYLVTPAR